MKKSTKDLLFVGGGILAIYFIFFNKNVSVDQGSPLPTNSAGSLDIGSAFTGLGQAFSGLGQVLGQLFSGLGFAGAGIGQAGAGIGQGINSSLAQIPSTIKSITDIPSSITQGIGDIFTLPIQFGSFIGNVLTYPFTGKTTSVSYNLSAGGLQSNTIKTGSSLFDVGYNNIVKAGNLNSLSILAQLSKVIIPSPQPHPPSESKSSYSGGSSALIIKNEFGGYSPIGVPMSVAPPKLLKK